jgi:5-methyltetrahydropteroyltriglutamate--homocysteine methyltransferase
VKQPVIAASALSLIYPEEGIPNYARDDFISDLVSEAQHDIRSALEEGAYKVQIDFTEGRLSLKLDPSGGLLRSFLDLNMRVLEGFTAPELQRIGIHTCPGGDLDSTHSLDVDYAGLLPALLELPVGSFYVQLASEPDRPRVLSLIRDNLPAHAVVFLGVIDPISPEVETAEEVCVRVLEAAEYIPPEQLGSCDDCGFAPFADDRSTSRATAFQKIKSRVDGTRLAEAKLGV